MDVDEPNIKTVVWIENKKPFKNTTEKETENKEHKKRVITQHKNWNFKAADLQPDAQLDLAKTLLLYIANDHIITDAKLLMVVRMLTDKLRSYRTQDMCKSIYSENEFITMQALIELFLRTNFTCYYCNEPAKLIYEEVRDPKQWTLERIDNSRGHNTDNVELACLSCNLRRRTMYHERYVLTKQMCNIVKST